MTCTLIKVLQQSNDYRLKKYTLKDELIMKGFPTGKKNEITIEFSVLCVTLKSSFLTASIFGGSISPALSLKQTK